MAQSTAIEWTDLSWNPTHGCSKVSPGCANCYAETLSLRYKQTLAPWTPANAVDNVILKPHKLREPLSSAADWRGLGDAAKAAGKTDGKLVFVNSMSDLFHEEIPDEYIAEVFGVMGAASRHTFQVLTKRPDRMWALLNSEEFWETINALCLSYGAESPVRRSRCSLPNVWLGVSIENRRFVDRADLLRETPAAVRFISAEPLIGPLFPTYEPEYGDYGQVLGGERVWPDGKPESDEYRALDLTGIDWLIVGGESGPKHRPIQADWVRDLHCEAHAAGTAFFFKQWGGSTAKAGGRKLDGRQWSEFPQAVVPA